MLSKINPRKSNGPDGLPGRVLKECSNQLSHIVSKLYQISLDTHIIPEKWLTAELVPVPKTNFPSCKNELRPIALTAIIMKTLERLVFKILDPSKLVDKSQFAYINERGTEDAMLTLQHLLYEHLDNARNYVRLLFIDFSSAFNTIQPHLMIQKLKAMGVNSNLIMWINSFLTNRKQYVRYKSELSDTITISTGGPQGCVLSAGLFILYTSDKTPKSDRCRIMKYADDTVIVGLLNDDDESEQEYRNEIESFVTWCQENFLNLNVKKTKEMIVDFRKKKGSVEPVIINGESVDIVSNYKYLGCIVDSKLKGNDHVSKIAKKANQRLYFVRKLKKVGVGKKVLSSFYKSIVESIMCYCMTSWYGNVSKNDRKKLKRVINSARRMGCDVTSLDKLYKLTITAKSKKIMKDISHPLKKCFRELKSGRRLNIVGYNTERMRNSFVPSAIRINNATVV